MSYRFMRVMVFFDLPTITPADRREYRKFHRTLEKNGFLMLQKSVYCRILLTPSAIGSVVDTIRKEKPAKGIVQILTVTEKQFSRMEYIIGAVQSEVIGTDERLVVL